MGGIRRFYPYSISTFSVDVSASIGTRHDGEMELALKITYMTPRRGGGGGIFRRMRYFMVARFLNRTDKVRAALVAA